MTAAKMLQRSPGKALSILLRWPDKWHVAGKTGILDVPEKTRFLSPTAVLDQRQEGAKWVSKLHHFSGGAPYYLLQRFSTGAQGARNGFRNYISSPERTSIFFLDTLWKSPVAVRKSRRTFWLRQGSIEYRSADYARL